MPGRGLGDAGITTVHMTITRYLCVRCKTPHMIYIYMDETNYAGTRFQTGTEVSSVRFRISCRT